VYLSSQILEVTDQERTAACGNETIQGPMWIFGTVLPWYGDQHRKSVREEAEIQQHDWSHFDLTASE
jgi:hypothetical protein